MAEFYSILLLSLLAISFIILGLSQKRLYALGIGAILLMTMGMTVYGDGIDRLESITQTTIDANTTIENYNYQPVTRQDSSVLALGFTSFGAGIALLFLVLSNVPAQRGSVLEL